MQRRRPGDKVRMSIRRRGVTQEVTIAIEEDPRLQVVPVETTGRPMTPAERAFRNAWLGIKAMSEESARNWSVTYITVICVEILVLLALWWLQTHFTV